MQTQHPCTTSMITMMTRTRMAMLQEARHPSVRLLEVLQEARQASVEPALAGIDLCEWQHFFCLDSRVTLIMLRVSMPPQMYSCVHLTALSILLVDVNYQDQEKKEERRKKDERRTETKKSEEERARPKGPKLTHSKKEERRTKEKEQGPNLYISTSRSPTPWRRLLVYLPLYYYNLLAFLKQ